MKTLNILWISIIQIIWTEISASPFQQLPRITTRTKRESDILFPDEETIFIPSAGESVPKCAKGATFCELIDDYPKAYVDLILEKNAHKYEELFGADLVMPDSILNRYDGFEEEESLCRSQERLIYPQAGLTQDNTWMYIVNQRNYTQGVRVDECIHMKQCEMTQNFPLGYEAICKQKYIYRQLLAINENGNTVKDLFRLPSCCQCVLIHAQRKRRSIR